MKTKFLLMICLLITTGLVAQPAFTLVEDNLLEGCEYGDIVYDESSGIGFVTNGRDVFMTTDGSTWELTDFPGLIDRDYIDDLALLDGRFFMAAAGSFYEYNIAGGFWEEQAGITNGYVNSTHTVNGKLFAIGTYYTGDTYIFTSDNYGTNWNERAFLGQDWYDIVDDSYGYFIFANQDSVCYTSDGINVTTIDFTAIGGLGNGDAAYMTAEQSTDYFYYKGDTIARYDASDDTWTGLTQSAVANVIMFEGAAACDSVLYLGAVSFSGFSLGVHLLASYDHGDTWTEIANPGIGSLPFIENVYQYAEDGYFINSVMYELFASTDGTTFTSTQDNLYNARYQIAVNDNVVIRGTENFGIVRSEDLLTWNSGNSGLPALLEDIIWVVDVLNHNGTLYASIITDPMNNACGLFKSTNNGQSWSEVATHPSDDVFLFGGNDGDYFYIVLETQTGREYLGYNADASSYLDLTSSIEALNPTKVFGVTGDGTYTYLFMETASDNTVVYYSDDHGQNWTETLFNETSLEFCLSEEGSSYQGKAATMIDDDGLPAVLMYDDYNSTNQLYKLNNDMTDWEEVVATGLPSGSKIAFTLNSNVTDHENIIVCSEGVFSGSSMDTWNAYGGGFRQGIDVVTGGLMGTELVMGTNGSGIWTIELIPTGKETVDVG
ncbi:MAG: hypothetical protein PF590_10395 [Candidatus Delongbacteria bacterium]|jgi:hypothetical protein|nr:hypothetical protein [Candidatus Delongbacteria bacterium]